MQQDCTTGYSCEGCPDFVYMTTAYKTCRRGGNPCRRRREVEQDREEYFRLPTDPDGGDVLEPVHQKGPRWPVCHQRKQKKGRHR